MIFFLIPVYNEADNLENLIRETKSVMENTGDMFQFLFVNDGSTDNSLKVLEEIAAGENNIIILSHFPNLGVKEAFLKGFRWFIENRNKEDILITKEADNTSDSSITKQMVDMLKGGKCDVVLASCYMEGGGFEKTDWHRKIMSYTANSLIKLRFNMWNLHTFSSFYRAFTFTCLKEAFQKDENLMSHNGFVSVVEMLIKLKRQGYRIMEVPMILKSSQRKGMSKMPVFRTIMGYLKLVTATAKK